MNEPSSKSEVASSKVASYLSEATLHVFIDRGEHAIAHDVDVANIAAEVLSLRHRVESLTPPRSAAGLPDCDYPDCHDQAEWKVVHRTAKPYTRHACHEHQAWALAGSAAMVVAIADRADNTKLREVNKALLAACEMVCADHPAGWPPEMIRDKDEEAAKACRAAIAEARPTPPRSPATSAFVDSPRE